MEGVVGGSLVEGREQLNVRVKMSTADDGQSALWDFYVIAPGIGTATRSGLFAGIPLLSLGKPELVPAESVINRHNGERVNGQVSVAVNVYILSAEHDRDEDFASQSVFWTTVLSAVTVSILLALT